MRPRTVLARLAFASIALAASLPCAAGEGAAGGPPKDAGAQRAAPPHGGGPESRTTAPATRDGATIQWFATLERGLAEARRTGKPILLVSGAPHCAGVSGMWCPGKVKIDNGWLLHDDVIAAAKEFTCIRLTSYESQAEADFVAKLEGNPVNTVFAVLTPDGQPAIAMQGHGRGPGEMFKDTADMVRQMAAVAAKYPSHDDGSTPALPVTLDARLGLAVASADLQPLVLVVEPDATARAALEAKVAKMAWSPEMRGRFAYASTAAPHDITLSGDTDLARGVLLVEPDLFGATGRVVCKVKSDDLQAGLATAMRDTLAHHVRPEKSRGELRRLALARGIFFQTGIPVTGRKEAEDRARYKAQLEQARATAPGTP